jgi:predicted dehydrogenase
VKQTGSEAADTTVSSSSATAPLRLGIVGCGSIVQDFHLPTILGHGDLKVAVLCDKDLAAATRVRLRFGLSALVTTELTDVAANADIALVAVPSRFHKSTCCTLLERGLDVLCEKPLAASPAEAREMSASAERAGRLLGVGFMTRFLGGNELLKAVLQEGLIGEPQQVKCEVGAPLDGPMSGDTYYNLAFTRGGVLFEAGIHIVDRVTGLFGPIEVLSFEDDSFGGVESNAFLAGRVPVLGRPIPCSMLFSWTHLLRNTIEVIGSRATAVLSRSFPESVLIERCIGGRPAELMLTWKGGAHYESDKHGFHREWTDFADAVRTRRPPLNDGRSSIRVLETIEQAYAMRTPMAQPWVTA